LVAVDCLIAGVTVVCATGASFVLADFSVTVVDVMVVVVVGVVLVGLIVVVVSVVVVVGVVGVVLISDRALIGLFG